MRSEKLYLTDIIEASESITSFCEGVNFESFLSDELRQSAVLQKLIVIGEAAARLSNEFKEKYSEVPWIDIVGFRNIVLHEYFSISWKIVWVTVTEDVPALKRQVITILKEINSDHNGDNAKEEFIDE